MGNHVLSFHYTLIHKQGKTMDSSRSGPPLQILEGKGQIILGLEQTLFQMTAGDKKRIHVPAAQA